MRNMHISVVYSVYFIPVCIILGFIISIFYENMLYEHEMWGPKGITITLAVDLFINFFLYVVYGMIYMYGIFRVHRYSVFFSLPVLNLLMLGVIIVRVWGSIFDFLSSHARHKSGLEPIVYYFLPLIGFSLGIVLGSMLIQYIRWTDPKWSPP